MQCPKDSFGEASKENFCHKNRFFAFAQNDK